MKTDRFFKIRNWQKFQHYTHRNPPWIRLYRDLLRDRGYQSLSDTGRSHLVGLFLIAAITDNHIPDDQRWLRHELCTKSPIDLKALVASGWIEYEEQDASGMLAASSALAECKQDAIADSDTEDTEDRRQIQILAYGEFSRCLLSEDQLQKLKTKLNGHHEAYIEAFDHWVNEAPDAKHGGIRRKDRHAYESITSWYNRDVREGKIKHAVSEKGRSAEEIRRRHGIQ